MGPSFCQVWGGNWGLGNVWGVDDVSCATAAEVDGLEVDVTDMPGVGMLIERLRPVGGGVAV